MIVLPAKTEPSVALSYKPDGIFFSNGPGDPEPCEYAIDAIQEFSKLKIPLFGICLGYQLMALAFGGRTKKNEVWASWRKSSCKGITIG